MSDQVTTCFGCRRKIVLTGVQPGEGYDLPYQVVMPTKHRILYQTATELRIRCPEAVTSTIRWQGEPSMRESEHCSPCQREGLKAAKYSKPALDDVQHMTWLGHYDRMIREYYDVEAEWALIKEICPELDRPKAAPRPVRRKRVKNRRRAHPLHGVALAYAGVATTFYVLGNAWTAAVWLVMALAVFCAASLGGRR